MIDAKRLRYAPVRPDGRRWDRSFTSEATAWRVVIGGVNSERERRERRARLVAEGWRVEPVAKSERPPSSPPRRTDTVAQ